MTDSIEDARAALEGVMELDATSEYRVVVRDNHVSVLTAHEVELRNAIRALIAAHEELLAEMHQRELHHFETEKLLTEAGIDPDNMEAARLAVERLTVPPTDDEDDLTLTQRIAKARVMHSFLPDDDDRSKNEYVADELTAAGFRRQGPIADEWERRTENRIHYQYGVNSGIYSGAFPYGMTASHDEQQRRLEGETSGPVNVTKRESRTVLYGPWEPVEAGRDAS